MKITYLILVVVILLSATTFVLGQQDSIGYYNPAFSPDGKQIVFESNKDGKYAIYTVHTDGTSLHKLTGGDSDSGQARWSPDGSKLVFYSSRSGYMKLYIMNSDGTGQRQITEGTDLDYQPDFSPKGDMIVFQSRPTKESTNHDIYVIRPNGTGRTKLTDGSTNYTGPRWSPDGKKISLGVTENINKFVPNYSRETMMKMTNEERSKVFTKIRNSFELYLMNADGSGLKRLTNNEVPYQGGDWSKNSQILYFISNRDGSPSLYSMKPDGTGVRKIEDGKIVSGSTISRDSRYFVYTKSVNNKSGIYIYEIKTKREHLLIGE